MKLKIAEIPITLYPDKRNRPPHLRSFRDGWRHLRFMLMFSPFHLFLIPGMLFFILGMGMMFLLLPGPVTIGAVSFDIHTMFFGMVFSLASMQIIFIGLFAKVFSYTEKFTDKEQLLAKYLKRFTLEVGLIIGGIVGLIGLACDIYAFVQWAQTGFSEFAQLRFIIFSSTFFLIGVQIFFSSFFLSMLGVSRDTYIGDYEEKTS